MTPERELEALGWCAATFARIEYVRAGDLLARPVVEVEALEIAVRVEVLGFHPVVAPSLAQAADAIQREMDAQDEADAAKRRRRRLSPGAVWSEHP